MCVHNCITNLVIVSTNVLCFGSSDRRAGINSEGEAAGNDDDDDDDDDDTIGICDAIIVTLNTRFNVEPGSPLHMATVFEHTDWYI